MVSLYRNLRFPYIYLNNHRAVITTSRYDSSSEISRHINFISDYVVHINTSTRFILTFEYDHYLSSETLEIFIKDLTKRFSPSLRSRFMVCIGKTNKDKITSWKNFVGNVRLSCEYLRGKLDIRIRLDQEKERKVIIRIYR